MVTGLLLMLSPTCQQQQDGADVLLLCSNLLALVAPEGPALVGARSG